MARRGQFQRYTVIPDGKSRAVDGGPWLFKRLGTLQFSIQLLQYEESFLFLSVIGDEPLAVEVILKTRKRSPRTTKVLENPECHPAKKGNTFQHDDLMFVKIFLILFGPTSLRIA